MAAPSVTWTFSNGTTADATQVNTNFTDIINALTDGSADITIGTLSVAGAATFSGSVTLGNATADDLTVTANLASNITLKSNTTYGIGSSTVGLSGIYLGGGTTKTTRIVAGTVGTSWTFTLPNDVPTITGQSLVFDTAGTASFRYPDKFTATKTTTYTATGDETVILCDPTSGGASFTITLPAASTCTGKMLTFVKIDSDLSKIVTIDGNGSETILPSMQSSNLTYNLYTQYESVTLKCNGTSWYVVDSYAKTPWVSAGAITLTAVTTNPTKGTMTTDRVLWRREGDTAFLRYEFYESATAGAANGSGAYLMALPTNLTADTTRVSAAAPAISLDEITSQVTTVGFGYGGTASASGAASAHLYDSTHIWVRASDSYASANFWGSAYYQLASAATAMCISAQLPISGWNP